MFPPRINKYILLIIVIFILSLIIVNYRYYPVVIINRSMNVDFSILSTKVFSWKDEIGIHGGIASGVFYVSKKDYDFNIKRCSKISNFPVNDAISLNNSFGDKRELGDIECTLHTDMKISEKEYLLFFKSESNCCFIKYIAIIN